MKNLKHIELAIKANAQPKPFVWTDKVIEAMAKAREGK